MIAGSLLSLVLFAEPTSAFVTWTHSRPLSPVKQLTPWQSLPSATQTVDLGYNDGTLSFPPIRSGVNLIGNYILVDQKMAPGTKAHLYNALLGIVIPLIFSQISMMKSPAAVAGTALSQGIIKGSFIGLVIDNLINASGKHIGEGILLRRLTQLRLVLHGITIPSLFIPVIEVAMHHNLFSLRTSELAIGAAMAYALYECIEWMFFYNINDLEVVDNRDSRSHTPQAIAGTLTYTSGRILKCVLPAAILQLFTLTIGCVLWAGHGAIGVGGLWLMASGALTILSCSVQRPHIQAYGETKMLTLMWAAVLSV